MLLLRRILFKDDLEHFNNFRRHTESFNGARRAKDNVKELGIYSFELKFFRLMIMKKGNERQTFVILFTLKVSGI